MKIELREVSISALTAGYEDNNEGGVRGYGGRLDIRPPYQREFVYDDKKRAAVIDTVLKGFPLNVMYWAVRGDGTFEVIDGQQRTISISQYVAGDFSVMTPYHDAPLAFGDLAPDIQERLLGYKLMIYFCEGTDQERLSWFKTINIAGEELKDQELRNAVFAGPWLSDAKRYFSRTGCAAYQIGSKYMSGTPIRQDYLETAIKWKGRGDIDGYMSKHRQDSNALALWQYFQSVITWLEATFVHTPARQKLMKGLAWGPLYDRFKDKVLDTDAIERTIARLLLDDDVSNKRGVFDYALTGDERNLNIRAFTESQKQTAYARQQGICAVCGKHFELPEMEADHITPWHAGGKTEPANCQMLCRECNRRKSGK